MLLVGLGAEVSSGCAQRVWNDRLGNADTELFYDFRNRLPQNSDELFVVLAFPGGGTRAAAFSYGVLDSLRRTSISIHGKQRRLLDEVDVITSVSGGSYTAAYYGLFGEPIPVLGPVDLPGRRCGYGIVGGTGCIGRYTALARNASAT